MYIEGIALEHLSELTKADTNSTTPSHQRYAVLRYFLSNDRKQDYITTTVHSKHLISLLKHKKLLTTYLSKIRENTNGCAEQYRYASVLHLMSIMSQCYSVIIDQGISFPGHVKEVIDVLNASVNLHLGIKYF